MPDTDVVGAPDTGPILLRSRNARIAVTHIQGGINAVRQSRDPNPRCYLARRRVVTLHLVIEPAYAGAIGAENDVVAVCARNVTAVGNGSKQRVRDVEQERKVDLIRIRNSAMCDRNR